MQRCGWASGNDEMLRRYHDEEYGRCKHGDIALFEKLCLECFQAGLSWRTVLYKREALRQCFFGFDAARMAAMTQNDIDRLMGDERIIRCRRKIEAVIRNARRQVELFAALGSFETYVYGFGSGESLSKDMKRLGYAFAGPTICEAFLQSVGAMEGHEPQCELFGGVR